MFASVSRTFSRAAALAAASLLAIAAGGDRPAQAWSLKEAAQPYSGTEIRGICDGYAPCLAYIELAKKFEAETGIKVNLEVADLEAIQTQFLTDLITEGQYYDFVNKVTRKRYKY